MSRAARVCGTALGSCLLVALAACGGRGPVPGLALGSACVAVDGSLPADATLADMAGEYRLVMVRGGAAPASTEGPLTLGSRPAAMRAWGDATTPLSGAVNIDLAAVGAHQVGALNTSDPAAPGALVLERGVTGARSVMVRLGSDSNRPDVLMFDAAYTVLWVRAITDAGFAGGWTSGARNEEIEGYFCAQKRAD